MKRIFFLMTFVVSQAMSAVFNPQEIQTLKQHFFANFHPNGAIVASPSQVNPNYYYDWIRDSAIAMALVETWYETNHTDQYKHYLLQYVDWTSNIQQQDDPLPGMDILGEPKFYINGYPFDGKWGRPQNDGPALRASILARFAHELLNQGEADYVQSHLYQANLDPLQMGVIKRDLEYTAHHWQEADFDLWEEVLGHHFFTAMVQQKALRDGSMLARRLNDIDAADFYETQARLIESRLKRHLDPDHLIIQATLPPHFGPQKTWELDSSVILGVLLNPQKEGPFSINHSFVKHTVKALHEQFNALFPINNKAEGAILYGRYPGDTYDGYRNDGLGNPWFILTATVAEYYYTCARDLPKTPANKALSVQYIKTGDAYLALIKQYAPDLNLDEQINLHTGVQQGANSLTWSYTSVLRAIALREQLNTIG